MINLTKYLYIFFSLLFVVLLGSCNTTNDDPNNPQIDKCKQSLLIYMIGSNNLDSFMKKDIQEIYIAAKHIDLNEYKILIYEHGVDTPPVLYQLIKNNGEIEKKIVSSYIETVSSASKERLSHVIEEMKTAAPANKYGLILWSHALGWIEGNSPQKLKFVDSEISPTWYGDDYGTNMNIDDLALAIPDDLFHYIWMDCCYMSSIEFIYQLRNKCKWFIGYPTEILADGMPYTLTIPFIMKEPVDLISAAAATFDYYLYNEKSQMRSCTIAVVDMSQIKNIALKAKEIFMSIHNFQVDTSNIQVYSRNISLPFYDLGDYVNAICNINKIDSKYHEFINTLNSAVIYKRATSKFLSIQINESKYSGISTHIMKKDGSNQEEYYKTLDWYKAVFN